MKTPTEEIAENKEDLYYGLILHHDVTCFDRLAFHHFGVDCSMNEILSACLFAGDSLHYLPGYMWLAEFEEENIFYDAICLIHRQGMFLESSNGIVPLKHDIKTWLRSMYTFNTRRICDNDSLQNLLLTVKDDSSYVALRNKIPFEKLAPIAKSLADQEELSSAACDVFLKYITSKYNYLAEPIVADTALLYLEKSVDGNFLPAIFYKSLLLLTGVYLQQDTIMGRELFLSCIDSIDCDPFWRRKLDYQTLVSK